MAASVQVIQNPDIAGVLLNSARVRMIERLGDGDSAAGLARKLDMPRQQINYHLRELESAGLVELVEERRKGNCMERVVRPAARAYLISPEALGGLGASPGEQRDRFSIAYLVALAGRAIRDLARLADRASAAGKRVATLAVETELRFKSASDRHAFAEELTADIARLAAKYHDAASPGGRTFRLMLGVYPATGRDSDGPKSDSVRME